jgi:hypothetical protein
MVWFAHPIIAYLTYMPIAMVVLLLPWSRMNYDSPRGQQLLPYHMLGGALVNSLISAVMTHFGVGMSMMFALWGGCGTLAALTMAWVSRIIDGQVNSCRKVQHLCAAGLSEYS